jgi:hypothetical protein
MSNIAIRKWHGYLGLLIAPSVLFFALTGALQLFSLHESHGDYHPPALLEKLAAVHKDQVFQAEDHHPPDAAEGPPGKPDSEGAPERGPVSRGAPGEDRERQSIATLLLKCFFLLVALGLASSSVLGVWMGLSQPRSRKTAWMLIIVGTLIPVALLLSL